MAPEKTVGPATTITFAGVELNSVLMEARLPQEKLVKCRDLIAAFLTRRKVALKEIQSLTGLSNFACSVVVPGRAFLRRLIDLTRGIRHPSFQIWLSNFYGLLTKREVKMRDIGQTLFCVFARGQYPAILVEQAWSIKDLLYGNNGGNNNTKFAEKSRAVTSEQERPICLVSQSRPRVYLIFTARGTSHIIK